MPLRLLAALALVATTRGGGAAPPPPPPLPPCNASFPCSNNGSCVPQQCFDYVQVDADCWDGAEDCARRRRLAEPASFREFWEADGSGQHRRRRLGGGGPVVYKKVYRSYGECMQFNSLEQTYCKCHGKWDGEYCDVNQGAVNDNWQYWFHIILVLWFCSFFFMNRCGSAIGKLIGLGGGHGHGDHGDSHNAVHAVPAPGLTPVGPRAAAKPKAPMRAAAAAVSDADDDSPNKKAVIGANYYADV